MPVSPINYSSPLETLIPRPVSVQPLEGQFELDSHSAIYIQGDSAELKRMGRFLADKINLVTGFNLPILTGSGDLGNKRFILTTHHADPQLGEEGYELSVTPQSVRIRAGQPAGVFYGLQTLRQLLPPEIEGDKLSFVAWAIPGCIITDRPRFEWRGANLDVARHFFSITDVKRYMDLAAAYKLNRFHLHLSDDQGWRVEIKSWPNLTLHGGSTEVGGGPGGFYSQAEYADLAAYARERYMLLVPEIDMPGHVNAAQASVPQLNPDHNAPALYTGTEVGFSVFNVYDEFTYAFIKDVFSELAAITPGPYLHMGGDEVLTLDKQDYVVFVERVQAIVASLGKTMVGWDEIGHARLLPTSLVQYWNTGLANKPDLKGSKVILSPASKTYLDMKYDETCPLGLRWAALVEVADAYNWEPAAMLDGVEEADIMGVEACLWSETILNMTDMEYMLFPRLPGVAEIAWSPKEGRNWEEYRCRLGAQGARLKAMGINYYRSGQVPWKE